MTKIHLLLTNDFRPYVEATIRGPRLKPSRIEFLIDTGSPETIISEGSALILKIPYKRLPKGKPARGWGGASYDTHIFKNVTIYFKTDKNQIFPVHLKEVSISELTTKMSEKERQISLSFPSVIGTDFFKNNEILLHFNPTKSIAYFKKED